MRIRAQGKKLYVMVPFLLAVFLLAAAPSTQPGAVGSNRALFLPVVTYPSGGYDLSLAVADVNGDGKADLLVADYNGGVDVLLGNGDGTFRGAVFYSAGAYSVFSVAVADVNGDGKPDVVLAIFYSNAVAVLMGNGDGSFQPAVTYPSGGGCPDSVAIADVNGDAKPDLVVTNWCGGLDVLLGNGDGTFQPAVGYSSGGEVPESVVVADVNGDGKPDLVVANWWESFQHIQNGSAGVLLGNGDGTFQPTVIYGSGGYGAASAAVADVNGEASPGHICTSVGMGQGLVGVLLGNGDGSFQPAVTYDLGGLGAGFVAVADVNGDRKPDVMVGSCGSSNCKWLGGCADGQRGRDLPAGGSLCLRRIRCCLGGGRGCEPRHQAGPVGGDVCRLWLFHRSSGRVARRPRRYNSTRDHRFCYSENLVAAEWESGAGNCFGTITDVQSRVDLSGAAFEVSDEYGEI